MKKGKSNETNSKVLLKRRKRVRSPEVKFLPTKSKMKMTQTRKKRRKVAWRPRVITLLIQALALLRKEQLQTKGLDRI